MKVERALGRDGVGTFAGLVVRGILIFVERWEMGGEVFGEGITAG
jgi:hypothetical protein